MAALLHELEVRNQEIARLHDIVAALTHAVEQRPMLPVGETPPETAPEPPGSPETNDLAPRGVLAWLRRLLGG